MTLPAVLRAALLATLAAALLLPPSDDGAAPGGRTVRLAAGGPARWGDSVLVGTPPTLAVRATDEPPTATELDALAAVADRSPLLVRLPKAVRLVQASPPGRPTVGRAAAIPFRLHAPPGDSVIVRLADETGTLDSVRVAPSRDGVAAGAFRVRPPREGWREWTVWAGAQRARVGAWVAPGMPPRVLVAAGLPGWEPKFVVRALEESGATVELSEPLGRGLAVRQGGGGIPTDAAALARFDAVVVLEGAELGPAQRSALAEYASRRGGGVLYAGTGTGEDTEVAGDRIRWTLPAELTPLPVSPVRSAAVPLAPPGPGALAGATSPQGTLLALRVAGRGREATLGMTETWRWRMESGQIAEHREFWRSLVDWLASAPREPLVVQPEQSVGPPGAPVAVRVFARETAGADAAAPAFYVVRPGAARETLPLVPDPERPGTLRGVFVPAGPGVYALGVNGGPPVAGFRAEADSGSGPEPWARAALLADRSGGAAVPADSFGAVLRRREASLGGAGSSRPPARLLLLGLAAVLAVAEWALRRLKGRA